MLQFLFIFELNILFGNMKKMSWGGGRSTIIWI